MRTRSSASALVVLAASRTINANPIAIRESNGIQWGTDCGYDVKGLAECGTLEVPLDYTSETDTRTVTLQLIKNKATTQPAPKGSILLNYGGPGGDGVYNFGLYAALQRKYIGDDYDMISWDPRGTRGTLRANCWNKTDPLDPAYLPLYKFGAVLHDASDVAATNNWAESTLASSLCTEELADFGSYLGMAATSRDIMSIVDALGGDGLLNYWGISGGSVMGETVAAMFPDRMGRVIVDAVINGHQYYHQPVETEWFTDTDANFKGILQACIDVGPEKCSLATHASDCEDLYKKITDALEDLKFNPLPVLIPDAPSMIDYSTVGGQLYNWLYQSTNFPYVVAALDLLLQKNGTAIALAQAAIPKPDLPTDSVAPAWHATMAIRCPDRFPRPASEAELDPWFEESHKISPMFGYFGAQQNAQMCAQWGFTSAERYEGNFQVKTKNPVLFIGNSFDPATPLVSAKNMSSTFEGSVVLENEVYGHTTFETQPSNCTRDAILAYLNEGKLPEEGTKCKPNMPLASYITGEYAGLDGV